MYSGNAASGVCMHTLSRDSPVRPAPQSLFSISSVFLRTLFSVHNFLFPNVYNTTSFTFSITTNVNDYHTNYYHYYLVVAILSNPLLGYEPNSLPTEDGNASPPFAQVRNDYRHDILAMPFVTSNLFCSLSSHQSEGSIP